MKIDMLQLISFNLHKSYFISEKWRLIRWSSDKFTKHVIPTIYTEFNKKIQMGCCNQTMSKQQMEESLSLNIETQLENDSDFNDISIITSKSDCSKSLSSLSTLFTPRGLDSPDSNFKSFHYRTDYEKAFLSFTRNN